MIATSQVLHRTLLWAMVSAWPLAAWAETPTAEPPKPRIMIQGASAKATKPGVTRLGVAGITSARPTERVRTEPAVLRVMSLNIYRWATMPGAAPDYAALIEAQNVDVLGIQEGNWDWEIEGWPTDYSRSEQLHAALGECWQRRHRGHSAGGQ